MYLFTDDTWNNGEITKYVKTRGWVDRFMMEHAKAILDRRKYIIRADCTVAWLADLPRHWHKRFSFLGEIGYINKVNYKLSAEKGLEDVEIEFYAL